MQIKISEMNIRNPTTTRETKIAGKLFFVLEIFVVFEEINIKNKRIK